MVKAPAPGQFKTRLATADTLTTLPGKHVAFLPTLHDVDTTAGLKRLFS